MSKELVDSVLRKFAILKTDKQIWEPVWQEIGEFIRYYKQDFTSEQTKGEFLTEDIFDTTGPFGNKTMAAALTGNLLPNGAKTVAIRPPKDLSAAKDVKEYYEWVSETFAKYMELKKAGLNLAFDEYMQDAGAFGTGGIAMKDDEKDFDVPLKFSSWDLVHTYIDENTFGFIDTEYNEKDWLVQDAANEYGKEKLPEKARKAIEQGRFEETIKILVAIQPREKLQPGAKGNKAMPIASIHIATESETLLRESGFEEDPVTIARFAKASGEKYGRGPGVDALPDVRMANAQSEAIIRAAEKQLDPPLVVLNDGSLGSDYIDTSAGAISTLTFNGRIPSSQPIAPLFTVGEIRSMRETLQETREKIQQHFLIDRLLDLNNDTRMTAFETSVREKLRAESLSAVYNRQTTEMIDPLFRKAFNALFARGFLGVTSMDSAQAKKLKAKGVELRLIPEAVVERINENRDVYELDYTSPATRALKKEEITSMLGLLELVNNSIGSMPDMRFSVKAHEVVKLYTANTGGNSIILNSDEEAKDLKEAEAAAIAQQQQLDNANKAALAARDGAQAAQMIKE